MKPAGEASQRARLLVVGHGVSLGFALFALHLTATTTRIYYVEMLGHDWLESLPGAGRLMLSADALLWSTWFWLLPLCALGLWLDWRLNLHLLHKPNTLLLRLWAYGVFGSLLVTTAMCVGLFRFWMWTLEQPIGGLG